MDDPYTALGVSRENTLDEIKLAFHKLAHKHHPDKKGGDESVFKRISGAYAWLKQHHIQRPKGDPVKTQANNNRAQGPGADLMYEYDDITGRWYGPEDLDQDGYIVPTIVKEENPTEFAEKLAKLRASRLGNKPEPMNAKKWWKGSR